MQPSHLSPARAASDVKLWNIPLQLSMAGVALFALTMIPDVLDAKGIIRRHVTIGRHRTLEQDVEFGIAQIVEIGIRALSPAVNDTFTGVACVDWLGDALLVVAGMPRFDGAWYDPTGKARVRVRPLLLERLARMAFDQMRQAASDNPAVLIRILETIRRIAPRMPEDEPRKALRQVADAVREVGLAATPAAIDRDDVEAAWQRADLVLPGKREEDAA